MMENIKIQQQKETPFKFLVYDANQFKGSHIKKEQALKQKILIKRTKEKRAIRKMLKQNGISPFKYQIKQKARKIRKKDVDWYVIVSNHEQKQVT